MEKTYQKRIDQRPNKYNKLHMEANKFAGVDTSEGYVYQKGRIEKFHKVDTYANRKLNKGTFDIWEEKRKLNLLRQKKDILHEMVNLTQQEYYSRRGDHDNMSVVSNRSGESWATFASKDSYRSTASGGSVRGGGGGNGGQRSNSARLVKPRPSNVPLLALPSTQGSNQNSRRSIIG